MRTLINIFTLLLILVSISACNNKSDGMEIPMDGDVGSQFYVHLSFIDKAGNDIIATIEKTPMTLEMSSNLITTDEATYLKLEDYQMDTYLNGELIKPAEPFKHNFVNCLFGENSVNGKAAIELIASGVEQQLKVFMKSLNDSQDFGEHSIEWHFACPKLFGDNEKHVLKLDFELIVSNMPALGFQGELYFDDVPQKLYYPEYYGISPTYSIEGRDVNVPYCIINL